MTMYTLLLILIASANSSNHSSLNVSNTSSMGSTDEPTNLDRLLSLMMDEINQIQKNEIDDYGYTKIILIILFLVLILSIKTQMYKFCKCKKRKNNNLSKQCTTKAKSRVPSF
ncbi:hypothetical protein [Perigonia lusca single nucleopolyhedrovirus]|uniref:Uncharacterized protein n=1 Tax=Perigonia lusca single nucleopolyhedrovirus TaxID=1675865 RepID=A0A0M3N078_9ABAC|nr:hypothetical protein [Perigonia lusca single nucleopolyhedrovirus]AKN80689.1 hypothetical protein [Perigonia lusca single nucleopolyhedrovirus]